MMPDVLGANVTALLAMVAAAAAALLGMVAGAIAAYAWACHRAELLYNTWVAAARADLNAQATAMVPLADLPERPDWARPRGRVTRFRSRWTHSTGA